VAIGLTVDGSQPPVLGVVGVPAAVDDAEGRREALDAEGPAGVGRPGSGHLESAWRSGLDALPGVESRAARPRGTLDSLRWSGTAGAVPLGIGTSGLGLPGDAHRVQALAQLLLGLRV
jgi:hypothetical protein